MQSGIYETTSRNRFTIILQHARIALRGKNRLGIEDCVVGECSYLVQYCTIKHHTVGLTFRLVSSRQQHVSLLFESALCYVFVSLRVSLYAGLTLVTYCSSLYLCKVSRRQVSGINMLPKGRWVVAAQSILTGVLLASCTLASAREGTNWKRELWMSKSLSLGSYSKQESTDAWEKVTSVLKSAKKNATFPGTA